MVLGIGMSSSHRQDFPKMVLSKTGQWANTRKNFEADRNLTLCRAPTALSGLIVFLLWIWATPLAAGPQYRPDELVNRSDLIVDVRVSTTSRKGKIEIVEVIAPETSQHKAWLKAQLDLPLQQSSPFGNRHLWWRRFWE